MYTDVADACGKSVYNKASQRTRHGWPKIKFWPNTSFSSFGFMLHTFCCKCNRKYWCWCNNITHLILNVLEHFWFKKSIVVNLSKFHIFLCLFLSKFKSNSIFTCSWLYGNWIWNEKEVKEENVDTLHLNILPSHRFLLLLALTLT